MTFVSRETFSNWLKMGIWTTLKQEVPNNSCPLDPLPWSSIMLGMGWCTSGKLSSIGYWVSPYSPLDIESIGYLSTWQCHKWYYLTTTRCNINNIEEDKKPSFAGYGRILTAAPSTIANAALTTWKPMASGHVGNQDRDGSLRPEDAVEEVAFQNPKSGPCSCGKSLGRRRSMRKIEENFA